MKKRLILHLAVLVAVEVVLVWGVFVAAPHPGGDNAAYVTLAHALGSGDGYTELWDPAAPPHTKYPPVFSVLLTVAMALGAGSWGTLKLVPLATAVLVPVAVFLWGRRRVGDGVALGVALLTGLSPSLLYHSHWLLSDVPFVLFTLLALWLLEAREGPDGVSISQGGAAARWLLPAGLVCLLLAYFTRSAGLPLVVAAVGALVLRRGWRDVAILAPAVGIPAALWWLRGRAAGPGEGRYGSEFFLRDPYQPDLGRADLGDFVTRFMENLGGYGTRFLPDALAGGAGGWVALLTMALLALALVGWGLSIRRRVGTAELFVPLYTGLILLWPAVWSGDRFALPLVPLLLLFAAQGLQELAERFGGGLKAAALLVPALLVALPAGQDWMAARAEAARCRGAAQAVGPFACGGEALVDLVSAARWAGENLPEGSAVLTRKPRIWYLNSGVPTRTYPFTEAPGVLQEDAAAIGAQYVLLDYVGGQGVRYVGAAVAADPGRFCEVAAFVGSGAVPASRLLRILPPGEVSGSSAAEEGIRLAPCPASGAGVVVSRSRDPGLLSWEIPILAR